MDVIYARNVNDALEKGTEYIIHNSMEVAPRGKKTLEAVGPVTTVYARPEERVLFSEARDANPFFHFFEALWMLAGRKDLKFVEQFLPRLRDFSDDGLTIWGAYGWRWKSYFDTDQVENVVKLLKQDNDSRRAVISMWSVGGDQLGRPKPGARGGGPQGKDVPCNTGLYFKVRGGSLRMTITNRSNDMLWGAYGANAVHLSMLQEYIACKLGLKVGAMTQMSDSFHVYTEGPGGVLWEKVKKAWTMSGLLEQYYDNGCTAYPLGAETTHWDTDLAYFFNQFDEGGPITGPWRTPYFYEVVEPMWVSWKNRKVHKNLKATDWQYAVEGWLERRAKV